MTSQEQGRWGASGGSDAWHDLRLVKLYSFEYISVATNSLVNVRLFMASNTLDKNGCTRKGSLVCERISSNSSLERK